MLRWSVLALALVVNLPVMYESLVEQTVPVDSMITRLLVTIPIVAALLAGLRLATRKPSDG